MYDVSEIPTDYGPTTRHGSQSHMKGISQMILRYNTRTDVSVTQ